MVLTLSYSARKNTFKVIKYCNLSFGQTQNMHIVHVG